MLRPYRITHVATQHPGESACGPRMARAVLPVCVARDDGEWTANRHGDHRLRVGMNHDWSTEPEPMVAVAISSPLTIIARDRKSTRLNSSHRCISYAVLCLKKK